MSFKKILAVVMACAMAIGAFAASALTLDVAEAADETVDEVAVLAATTADVAVGEGQTYTALKDALAHATDVDNDGVVTVGVYGKVEIGATFQLNVAAETVNIVGMNDAAEIYVTAKPADNGIVYVANNAIETLNFKDITLSRPNGEWRGNEGHHNRFFTVWDNDGRITDITYTNCVFPYGAGNNQYGKTTYTDCTFNNDTYYALWIYGSGSATSVVVTGGTFVADRGVKIYSEDAAAVVDTKITGATFDIASKPAIVSSIAGTVTIENVNATACEYGLLATEPKDGRSDLAMAVVTVDGEAPAYVAKVGNMLCTDVDYAEAEATDAKPVQKLVAIYNGVRYYTLQSLVDAVDAGATIELADDVTVDATVVINKNLTINGNGFTVKGTDVTETETNGTAVTPFEVNGATVNFNNITVKGGNAYNNDPYQPTASHGVAGAGIKAVNANVNIDNSTIAGGDAGAEFTKSVGSAIVAENSNIVATNSTLATGRTTRSNVIGVATVYLDATSTIDLTDVVLDTAKSTFASDNVIASYHENGVDTTEYTGKVKLDGEIKVLGTRLANVTIVPGENLTFKGNVDASYISDTLEVLFVKKDVDDAGVDNDEEADLYDIVIHGNKQLINRLTTADLTFKLDSATAVKPVYEIIPVAPVKVTANADYANRYMFSFDGVTQPDETAKDIVIGQVKFTGYGAYSFYVDAAFNETNIVHATKTADSIVKEFTVDGVVADGEGKLIIDAKAEDVIEVPTRDLTINVSFPNSVEKNVADYQKMTVTVSGGDLANAVVVALGDGAQDVALAEYEKSTAKYTVAVADGYTVTLKDVLTVNTTYNVTVEGAGYRTARYTVTMTDAKVLNFWNNVKDNAVEVEEGKASSAVAKNFLAGDIVADNNINIYDLSAVVSYFATDATTDYDKYVKYDLNRDGKIDSKDVAYVLVSWGA